MMESQKKDDSLTQDAEREANRRRSERSANQRSEEEGMLDAVRKFRKEQEAQEPTSSSKKGKKQ